jgi:hypothetical protein
MSIPLQEFAPDKSTYERPTQTWVCGRASDGCPCHIGPSNAGECQADKECVPYKDGDGYRCARPPAWGGACEKGPNPDGSCCQTVILCQPRRSTKARRKIFSICSAGFILGVLLLVFGADPTSRNALTSPGELTLQHHSSRQRCSNCHTNAELSIDGMTGAGTAKESDDEPESVAIQDSRKCIQCHDMGETPLNPHSLSTEEITGLTGHAKTHKNTTGSAPWLVSFATNLGTSPMQSDQLACSVCHKEHRGKFFDLKKLADEQCQVCHTNQFHSFASEHPEFDDFPYSRRTRIHFDHTTHYGTHFSNFKRIMHNGVAPEKCRDCHKPDSTRQMMPVVNFGKACASCHSDQIQGPYSDIAFFAIPELDIRDQPVGEWPKSSSDFTPTAPKDLPAFMKVLLLTQPEWQEGQLILKHAESDAASQRGHQKLAVAMKTLIGDLIENGEEALQGRLLKALGENRDEEVAKLLANATAPMIETLNAGSLQWFPNLSGEWQSVGGDSPPAKVDVDVMGGLSSGMHEGWHIDESQSAIRFRPSRHADLVPKELIDAFVKIPGIEEEPDDQTSMGALRSLFRELTDPRGAFRCTKCHSIDRTEDGNLVANWHALNPESAPRDFVAFSHAPHVTLLQNDGGSTQGQDQDCRTCHLLEQLEDRDRKFVHPEYENLLGWGSVNVDRSTPSCSGFGATSKAVCAECHTRQSAGDSCLKCHNYHVDASIHRSGR